MDGRRVEFSDLGFANVAVEDGAGQSAYHVREGSLIIYPAPGRRVQRERAEISTLEIAPAILRTLGVESPSYMVDSRIAA